MPQMGPMVGYAVTIVIEPSNKSHRAVNPDAWNEYRRYVASIEGPKIVCVQDLDKPRVIGSFWGEVNSNMHRALGCVGTIVDGAIRDVDEMCNAGFRPWHGVCASVMPMSILCDGTAKSRSSDSRCSPVISSMRTNTDFS